MEVSAAGEEGGAGPQPPAMGTRSTLASPSPGAGRETQNRRREGLLTGSGTPLPLLERTDDEGMERRTEEKS